MLPYNLRAYAPHPSTIIVMTTDHCRFSFRSAVLLALLAVVLPLLPIGAGAADIEDSPEALFQHGLASFGSGDFEHSLEYLDALIKVFGAEPELQQRIDLAMYARGCALYNLQRFPESIDAFKKYAEKFPNSKFVDEAFFRIASAHQLNEDLGSAVAAYETLRSRFPASAYSEDALYQIGICHLLQDHSSDAATAFRSFLDEYPRSRMASQAGAYAARALFDDGEAEAAIDMLQQVESMSNRTWSVVTYCNFLAFEIGDYVFDDTDYDLALRAYRRVKPRSAILRHLQESVAALERLQERVQSERITPGTMSEHYRTERRLAAELKQNREMLDKLTQAPDYDSNLYHRIGRCFFNTDRFWEARVAFSRVVSTATDPDVKEAAHFDLILSISRLRRFPDLLIEADQYLATYDPEGHWQ